MDESLGVLEDEGGECKTEDLVNLIVSSAAQAQLSTMPEVDQKLLTAILQRLDESYPDLSGLKKIKGPGELWELRVNPDIRLVVRIVKERIFVIAVSRQDQLQEYLSRSGR